MKGVIFIIVASLSSIGINALVAPVRRKSQIIISRLPRRGCCSSIARTRTRTRTRTRARTRTKTRTRARTFTFTTLIDSSAHNDNHCRVFKKNSEEVNQTLPNLNQSVKAVTKIAVVVCCSSAFAYYRSDIIRKISASIIAATISSLLNNRIKQRKSTSVETEHVEEEEEIKPKVILTIWDDDQRIEKALAKAKRSNAWIDQSMTNIAETNQRIADKKAQEEALLEEKRKEMAKQWVAATMLSQNQAMDNARRLKREKEEVNLRAQQWAAKMIRNAGDRKS